MKNYLLIITNNAGAIEYKQVKSNENLETTIKMENGLLNSEWTVRNDLSFEITEAMQNHFKLIKEYAELEETMKQMTDAIYDHAQWVFSATVIEAMESELVAIQEKVKAAKAEMRSHIAAQDWTNAERRGMKKIFDGMKDITAGKL